MQHIKIHSKYITWQVSQDKMKFKIILKTDVSTAGLYTGTGGNNNGQLSIPVWEVTPDKQMQAWQNLPNSAWYQTCFTQLHPITLNQEDK